MRVLLVRAESTGGIGVHVESLARGLRESGHQVATLVATGKSAIPAIQRAARQVDVVHAHGIRAGAAACLATRKRVVVTVHNTPPNRAGELLLRFITRRANVVLGASQDLVAENVRFAPVVAPRLPPPRRSREEVRTELGLGADDDRRLVLAVGRLAPQKDYPTLLSALRSDDRLLVAVAGDGPLRDSLQARIDAEQLPVRLLGHRTRTDVADLLNAADVFLMCSVWEARPLALQEALRAGVPHIVATDVGGIADVVQGRIPLVAPRDPAALAEALAADSLPASTDPATTDWDVLWPGSADELAAVLGAYGAT